MRKKAAKTQPDMDKGVDVSTMSVSMQRRLAKKRDVVVLYTDGGCVYANPSPYGITWAWVAISRNNEVIMNASGLIETKDTTFKVLSNNHAEQIAIIKALEAMPNEWNGLLCSDSQIALGRVFKGYANKNVPGTMITRTKEAVLRLGVVTHMLLQGHPQVTDIENGIGEKRNRPVSIYNVLCDELCGLRAKEWKDNHPEVILNGRYKVETI